MSEPAKPKISHVEVYWHTVTYKTVATYVFLILVIILASFYLMLPETFGRVVHALTAAIDQQSATVGTAATKQARFVNLDGKVQVKKVSSVQWVNADYQMTLDKGDLVQTASDGVARLSFADGTTYTVKPDTLVTVEENLVPQDRASRVGMHVSSGELDLATGSWEVAGSKAEVSFENAVASLRENSRAAVRSDPSSKENEMTVARGSAEVDRGGQRLSVSKWEKIEFPTGGEVTRSQMLSPPELSEPLNLQPIMVPDPKKTVLKFSWKPVPTARAYQLRVSRTAMFTQVAGGKENFHDQHGDHRPGSRRVFLVRASDRRKRKCQRLG